MSNAMWSFDCRCPLNAPGTPSRPTGLNRRPAADSPWVRAAAPASPWEYVAGPSPGTDRPSPAPHCRACELRCI